MMIVPDGGNADNVDRRALLESADDAEFVLELQKGNKNIVLIQEKPTRDKHFNEY